MILPGGSLTAYAGGKISISGGGIVNQTLDPHSLTIYGTSTCTSASYSGSSSFYGSIYVPNGRVAISGKSSLYGIIIGDSVKISGGAAVHCDESL